MPLASAVRGRVEPLDFDLGEVAHSERQDRLFVKLTRASETVQNY